LFKLSAFTRNRGEIASDFVTIVAEPEAVSRIPGAAIDVVSAMALFPSQISERLDRALKNIERRSNYPGERFRIGLQDDYPLFYAENPDACWYIGQALEQAGWIETDNVMGSIDGSLTVRGWGRVAELEHTPVPHGTRQAFVAMHFDPTLETSYKEAIKKAIESTGFEPMRVDLKEHNGKICDAIIAEIRKSKFVVADFTGHRGGVYFEAGYAMGLGIPVIWLVETTIRTVCILIQGNTITLSGPMKQTSLRSLRGA
jgi:hypothetical protein